MISLFFLSILIALSGFENNEVSGKSILNLYYIQTYNIYIYYFIYQLCLQLLIFKGDPDCVYFKEQCQELCLIQSGGVSSAQCWGDPLYCYCKASDGTVFHIEGFVCEHPDCPPDAI